MRDKRKARLSTVLVPYIYKYLILAITFTCRIKVHGKHHIDKIQAQGKPWIYSIWHNNVPISPWALRKQNVTVMVSESNDGEIISRTVTLFGNTTIRGSTSKGSAIATRQALKTLKQNKPIAITPDGPRGPKYQLQDGVLWLAALSKTPIIPFHCECSRQKEFASWDKQKIPKPFSTIHLCFGEPINISRDQLDNEFKKTKHILEQAMMKNVNYALKQTGKGILD